VLWAIISSVFVIYLYRKLSVETIPEASGSAISDSNSAVDAELATLSKRIDALESRLDRGGMREVSP
jgi:hypothetical protein